MWWPVSDSLADVQAGAGNDRLRVEGTRNLLDGAREVGVARIVAQSVAFAYQPQPDRIRGRRR